MEDIDSFSHHDRRSVHASYGVTHESEELLQVISEELFAAEFGAAVGRRQDLAVDRRSPILDQVLDRIEELADFNASHSWVQTRHPALDDEPPLEAIVAGRGREVLALVEQDFAS